MSDLAQRVAEAHLQTCTFENEYITVTVPQIIASAASEHGMKTAIEFFDRDERLSYTELELGSNRVANALRTAGVGKGDRVAVMLPNRPEFPLIWVACAKLGAIFVPLNMRYTPREIRFVLADTQARFAIVDQTCWPTFSEIQPLPETLAPQGVILVGEEETEGLRNLAQLLEDATNTPVETDLTADDIMTIQYTSGTTGFPKGCILTHDYWGIVSAVQASRLLRKYQRHLCWAPLSYADGMIHFLSACRDGATVYMPARLSSTRFMDWLKSYRIEWTSMPELIARQPASPVDNEICLEQFQFGGGTWQPSSIENFAARVAARGNGFYGLTETAYATLPPNSTNEMTLLGASGLCAPFREIRLTDESGEPVPTGEVGELWVRGRGMFKGYWNRTEANAELFAGDWFKTGDLLRMDAHGFIYFSGRKKDMIRRSNENISAREVEAVICELPEVAAVAAVPVKDVERGEEVKIWIELKEGKTAPPIELILEHARTRLAAFKVPRYITFAPSLPRVVSNPNKVNKIELMDMQNPLADTYDAAEDVWR
ncbi:long-chain fatty acid--CoA ligase [Pokkaliibacter plantistimulans]|uniref:Long-chain fatty acid--CoA ligase n=1 Tax=Proteobacteria bacterium 228 TaxID=2083153 RepID=A0A2S5KHD0_9PROT|nr:class I adenylate-forming enzyme family protein [Pokkaliibacter plantistimulans]PPC74211.1 long-chain fatty acid--CoA ligase [Pokkaliibacter plantistimulans]